MLATDACEETDGGAGTRSAGVRGTARQRAQRSSSSADQRIVTRVPLRSIAEAASTRRAPDAAVAARFRADWRTIVPVSAMSSTPSRSQTELETCYLFGGQDLPEAQRPPTDPLQ